MKALGNTAYECSQHTHCIYMIQKGKTKMGHKVTYTHSVTIYELQESLVEILSTRLVNSCTFLSFIYVLSFTMSRHIGVG